jgi:fructose-bisphosphate aldolase class II
MRVSLKEMLPDAVGRNRVICGFNIFGYEDSVAVIEAAEEKKAPVLLMVNRAMADFMPPDLCGPMLSRLAERSSARIAVHLDHAWDLTAIERALDGGFSSVMYDGSNKPLAENIELTARARVLADRYGASLEGEVGTIPYDDLGETEVEMTDPSEAARFGEETGVDVLAVSVGNIHRLTTPTAKIDFSRLGEIERATSIPLVIHGVSGLPETEIRALLQTGVVKFNIGTRLRMAFGKRLQNEFDNDPGQFDRLHLMNKVIPAMRNAAIESLIVTGW